MWEQLKRIIKPSGAILLFAQTPFDKVLGASNLSMLKYEWIWEKTAATGHLNAKKAPMKAHENILVFYNKQPTYNPQKLYNQKPTNTYTKRNGDGECYGKTVEVSGGGDTERYPRSVQVFKSDKQKVSLHPTQKPIALMEYLIKTYSNEGDTVLDFTMGSSTTIVAALNTKRNAIGIELDKEYFKIGCNRVKECITTNNLDVQLIIKDCV
jgi:site-specific DNA-methyltransferase (adenine-specific)